MIDWIKIRGKVYINFIGCEWTQESDESIDSIIEGFKHQFTEYKGVLYMK